MLKNLLGILTGCFSIFRRRCVYGIIGLLIVLFNLHGNAFAMEAESRIILDEDFNWLTPESADRTLAKIKDAGFNIFVPCVWHGRGTTWPSLQAPREPLWQKRYRPGYDPLAYLIKRGHELGIEIHPWVTVNLRQREFLAEFVDDGTPEKSFNVHLPEYRIFIINLMLEVISKYDVDGINLDYIRTLGICTSDYCVRDYRERTGRNLVKDSVLLRVSTDAWENIAQWNSSAIDDLVFTFANSARKIKPELVISVDSHAGLNALRLQGTDSIKWANNGWIDAIFHMDYKEEINKTVFDSAIKQMQDPRKLVLMVGNYEKAILNKDNVWPREADRLNELLYLAQSYGQDGIGVALYEYRFLTNSQVKAIKSGPFKDPARPWWVKERGLNGITAPK